ncbi:PREDICTED: putative F-box protein At2g33200 [Camelina sativa]|uniref:F-box protein At2g33200 n=1 Tax=Camelina sativa TaxID=90675 RepID=A0ABM0ZB57_CAMSA|nr:PREDICTED: putative F-box protein At2g33200 [Camelina sativa]
MTTRSENSNIPNSTCQTIPQPKPTIHLPPLELSFFGIEQDDDYLEEWEYYFDRGDMVSGLAVVWINERTRDYVVAWACKRNFLFMFKKGDEAWRKNLQGTKCKDVAFKDNKLYVFTLDNYIKILDFSGDFPRESLENPYLNHRFTFEMARTESIWKRRLLVTNKGEVMVIQSSKVCKEKYVFQIFKMDFESGKWERVDSLGDEMLIFGHGVTVRTSVDDGGSIFFVGDDLWLDQKHCGVFHLATSTVTWSEQIGDAYSEIPRWFFPGYA